MKTIIKPRRWPNMTGFKSLIAKDGFEFNDQNQTAVIKFFGEKSTSLLS